LYALKVLTGNGNFNTLEDSRVELQNDFFGTNFLIQTQPTANNEAEIEHLEPAQIELSSPRMVALPEPQHPTTENLPPPNISRYSVETNLLLPPGTHQGQLEELLLDFGRKEQLEALIHIHFTGYVYYRPKTSTNQDGNYGLVLFNNGNITDIIYAIGINGTKQTGAEAYEILASQNLIPEIYKVELPVLKAYRAIISSEKPQRFPATKENFARIMTAFKQSGRDGVVLFYVDKLKLHYFFLFENGLQVGVFGTDSKSGRLQPLAAPLALPTVDSGASIMVMLANRTTSQENSEIMAAIARVKPKEVSPNVSNDPSISAPEAVKWNITLSNPLVNQNQNQNETTTPKKDNSNPYIF
jgi:hypothetical protein